MYWEVDPGTATVTDVRRLLREAMEEMPRKVRIGVVIVDGSTNARRGTGSYYRQSHAWACIGPKKRTRYVDARNRRRTRAATWEMRIARRTLFLPRKALVDCLKHEIGHALLEGAVTHGKEFKRFCAKHNMPVFIPGRDAAIARSRYWAWKKGLPYQIGEAPQ